MRKIIAFILVILSGFFFFQCGQRQPSQTAQQKQTPGKTAEYLLDTVITKQIPLTVDGDWATINYHLKVKDWAKPVEWTFDVLHGVDTLYSSISNDIEIDTFFYDTNYTEGLGKDYLSSKKYWYLTEIYKYYSDIINITDEKRRNFLKQFCREFIASSTDGSKEILYDSLWAYYNDKPIIAYNFYAGRPIDGDHGSWTYYPKINQFVCIYAP